MIYGIWRKILQSIFGVFSQRKQLNVMILPYLTLFSTILVHTQKIGRDDLFIFIVRLSF